MGPINNRMWFKESNRYIHKIEYFLDRETHVWIVNNPHHWFEDIDWLGLILFANISQIAMIMGPTGGSPGSYHCQVGPM